MDLGILLCHRQHPILLICWLHQVWLLESKRCKIIDQIHCTLRNGNRMEISFRLKCVYTSAKFDISYKHCFQTIEISSIFTMQYFNEFIKFFTKITRSFNEYFLEKQYLP